MKSNVCCVALVCLLVAPAHGQTPQAMECEANAACVALVEQAQKQSRGGQFAEAEKSYKLAYEVSHDARLLFNIARVLDKRGQGQEALTYYRQFIEAPVDEPEQKVKAREYVAQIEAMNDPPPKRLTAETPIQPAPSMTEPVARTTEPVARTTEPVARTTEPVARTTERKEVPVYKKGWFWGVMLGSVAAVGLGIGLGVGLSKQGPTVPSGTNTIGATF